MMHAAASRITWTDRTQAQRRTRVARDEGKEDEMSEEGDREESERLLESEISCNCICFRSKSVTSEGCGVQAA